VARVQKNNLHRTLQNPSKALVLCRNSFLWKIPTPKYTVIQNFGFPLPKHFGNNSYGDFELKKITRNFGFINGNFEFSYRNFGFFEPKLLVFQPKLRVFENRSFVFLNQSCSFCKDFFCPTETSGVGSGIFCDRNFGILNPYEVSNEVSVERKPEKFSKFQAKMNNSVTICTLF
jgi:hypothetical protein